MSDSRPTTAEADGGSILAMNRLPLYLIVFIVAMIVISNVFFDGTTAGGIAFLLWACALLLLVGLGVRSLVRRGERT